MKKWPLAVVVTACTVVGFVASKGKSETNKGPLPNMSQLSPMHGIDPKGIGSFWFTWTLVTTRYRQDSGEMRFVYANDLAWQAMKEGLTTYPDGAMFGKVAFRSSVDTAFPNSAEPGAWVRIQLMLKDSKKICLKGRLGLRLISAGLDTAKGGRRRG